MQAAHDYMNTDDLLAELYHIAERHLLWLQSEGKEGRRANLAGYDLSGLSLHGAYLPEASFRSAILTGTDFSGANLQGADFSEAQLNQANFIGASLDGANFSRTSARAVYFEDVTAVEANFSQAQMEGTTAIGADFSGVKFRDAQLNGVDFTNAKLLHANMRYANATQAMFDNADMSRADCRDTHFDYARFKAANLYETNMRNASFESVLFTDTDFSHVLDLDSRYQTESIAMEKKSIRQEIENLYSVREEVSHFEDQINQQRRELVNKRRVLQGLNELESEVSNTFMSYMKTFRQIAIFWFVIVALSATLVLGKVLDVGLEQLSQTHIWLIGGLMTAVLGAHVLSAALSFTMAKRFAFYVRLRQKKLRAAEIEMQQAQSKRKAETRIDETDEARVTYL